MSRRSCAERDAGRAVKHTPQLFACTEQEAREAIALNYGSISFIDDAVGRVLAQLEALGLADNTVVIFTSDHGDFMGDHQLLLKGPIHYRGLDPGAASSGAIRAGRAGRAATRCAGTIDLAPTILARAGVAPFNGIQGRDLGAAHRRHGDRAPRRAADRGGGPAPQMGFDGPHAHALARHRRATASASMTAPTGASSTISTPTPTRWSICGTIRRARACAPSWCCAWRAG